MLTDIIRQVFFSFHYQRDIWRVNQIRNIPLIMGKAAAGFKDNSLWEKAKLKGDAEIYRLIDEGLKGSSVTVVCIGSQTAGRKFINYEIRKSIERGNGILGLRIHHLRGSMFGLTDLPGLVPYQLTLGNYPVYTYNNREQLAKLIQSAAQAARR